MATTCTPQGGPIRRRPGQAGVAGGLSWRLPQGSRACTRACVPWQLAGQVQAWPLAPSSTAAGHAGRAGCTGHTRGLRETPGEGGGGMPGPREGGGRGGGQARGPWSRDTALPLLRHPPVGWGGHPGAGCLEAAPQTSPPWGRPSPQRGEQAHHQAHSSSRRSRAANLHPALGRAAARAKGARKPSCRQSLEPVSGLAQLKAIGVARMAHGRGFSGRTW